MGDAMRETCCALEVFPAFSRCERRAEWQVESEAFPTPKKLCGVHVTHYLHSRYPNTVTYLRTVSAE